MTDPHPGDRTFGDAFKMSDRTSGDGVDVGDRFKVLSNLPLIN
ncbi:MULTISPECIES: hypothetical protein [Fischerella]|nr:MULTISPECIES: hypothetical protein [Fischerella]